MNKFVFITGLICFVLSCAEHQHHGQPQAVSIPYHAHLRQVLEEKLFGSDLVINQQGYALLVEFPNSALFERDSAELNSSAYIELNEIADTLAQFQDTQLILSLTSDVADLELGQRQLNSLKNYFVARRVSARRVHIAKPCCGVTAEIAPLVHIKLIDNRAQPAK